MFPEFFCAEAVCHLAAQNAILTFALHGCTVDKLYTCAAFRA
jgi:hypothetical protein